MSDVSMLLTWHNFGLDHAYKSWHCLELQPLTLPINCSCVLSAVVGVQYDYANT